MEKNGKKNSRLTAAALVIAVIALAAVLAGVLIGRSEKSFPNLRIKNIPIGKMTGDEILKTLSDNGWDIKAGSVLTIESLCGTTQELTPLGAGILSDSESITAAALKYGKNGNIFQNLREYISCLFLSKDINAVYSEVNTDYINNAIKELQGKIDSSLSDGSFVLDRERCELKVYKGYGNRIQLKTDGLCEKIAELLESGQTEYTYKEILTQKIDPNLELLQENACTKPENACFSTDKSHTIVKERDGYSFDISQAETIWNGASVGDEIAIPLTVRKAEVTAEHLESMMYRDLLGAMTTKYNNSNENRSSNVRLAASLVNNTVLFPGEEFSFNDTVGKRTEEAGFLMAPAYAGYGDMKEEIGGGVCQVSTGIYASALFAFLEITSHTCHVYPPNYIQLGTDATVSIPESGRAIDFKFKNSKSYPVKIVGYCEETEDPKTGKPSKKVTIEIWGTLEESDYMPVEFDNAWGDVYDYDRIIEPAYPDRPGYRIQFTHDETEFEDDTGKGLRTLTYRRVYDSDGNVVEKKILNKEYSFGYGMDTYYYKE